MNIYKIMRMESAAIKSQIRNALDIKEKMIYTFAFCLKIISTVLFCMIVVLLFSAWFGSENALTGVITVIAIMVFEKADLGIKATHSVIALIIAFLLMAIGPHLASAVSPIAGLVINLLFIMTLLILTCHNLVMSNHATIILGYLLFMGSDVTGEAYLNRIAGLMLGGLIVSAIFYHKHYTITYRRTLIDLFKEFDLSSMRTQWQIKMSIGISFSLFLAQVLHFSRPMWIGIACMSLLQPFSHDMAFRARKRAPFTIIGSVAFGLIYCFLPSPLLPFVGILGGLCLGLCTSYKWQSAFNCFGAISTVVPQFGPIPAILIRIISNIFATIFCISFDKIFTLFTYIPTQKHPSQ